MVAVIGAIGAVAVDCIVAYLLLVHLGSVVVSLRVLVSTLWLLHCLPLACGRRRSLREDDPLSGRSCVVVHRGCSLLVML